MNADARYHALVTRDRRFDGVFFVGVSTTGIYCRPICPARTPGRPRCTFYDTAVQAEAAGFRACFRCRPELAPGNAEVDAVDQLVATATARITEGALNGASVDDLAAELGVTARHLRRTFDERLGVSPIELAQTRRLALAKQLLQDTGLSLTEIAFAAGYQSVRRFNAVFAEVMGSAPSKLRRSHVAPTGTRPTTLALRLEYRAPYDWEHVLAFLAARAIPGVERVEGGTYSRVVQIDAAVGLIAVTRDPKRDALVLSITPSLVPVVMKLVARVRALFDLDARPDVIAGVFARDPRLGPLVARRPGLRVPGAIDGFEAAVRAMLGQQVSVAAATTLAGRFVEAFGTRYDDGARFSPAKPTKLVRDLVRTDIRNFGPIVVATPRPHVENGSSESLFANVRSHPDRLRFRGVAGVEPGPVEYRFPSAGEIAAVGVDAIAKVGLPGARAAAIHGLAVAVADGSLRLDGRNLERFVEQAVALRGIGPWTANYLAMRALHLPDAFPAADLGVLKALRATARECETRAEAWRPFRSYAVIHLWSSLGDSDVEDDHDRVTTRVAAPRGTRRRARGRVSAGAGRAGGTREQRDAASGGNGAGARRAAARRVLRGRAPLVRSRDQPSRRQQR